MATSLSWRLMFSGWASGNAGQDMETRKKLIDLPLVVIVIIAFDTIASVTSRAMEVNYSDFALGSAILYFLAGLILTWRHGFLVGLIAGFLSGLADSTIGLAISIWIGPEELRGFMLADAGTLLFIVASVTLEAGIIGLFGSATAWLIKRLFPSAT